MEGFNVTAFPFHVRFQSVGLMGVVIFAPQPHGHL